jgi:hypothetical protein
MARASEYARYLGLVDFDSIEDHKNEGETVRVVYSPDEVCTDFTVSSKSLTHPEIEDIEGVVEDLGSSCIEYGKSIRQPYHLELWIEKSTMNDILIPIVKKYGATLMVASGHFSITNVKNLFTRVKDLDKPIRIFYIRDFDPAGETMPTAVARKIEWFIRTQRPEVDLKLFDICLTHEQCVKYQLPRYPMDRKERYKGNFEGKYGEGATELDALEALYPGTMASIVIDAISPYFDETLHEDILDFEESENERYEEYKGDIVEEVVEVNKVELEPLVKQYNNLMRQVNKVGGRIEELIYSTHVNYNFEPEYPDGSSHRVDKEKDYILDTQISYEQQMGRYHGVVKN